MSNIAGHVPDLIFDLSAYYSRVHNELAIMVGALISF
jgi:hypothetical protein